MTEHGPWDECPTGLVTKMAGQLRAKQLRARLRPMMAAVAILLVLGGTWAVQSKIGDGAEPLTCVETVPMLADYHSGNLEGSVATRVDEHLANCPSCRKHFEDQFPGEARIVEDADKLVALRARSVLLAAR
ncbi:MAG: hypothetical protein CMJ64_07370 [Planctomycetaceae bacterium]|nr:hypothetical protein [Planctomycetaceae bacterium]